MQHLSVESEIIEFGITELNSLIRNLEEIETARFILQPMINRKDD